VSGSGFPDVVVAELAYVLTSVYELGVAEAAGLLGRILDLPGVEVADKPLLRDALLLWDQTRLDFTDAYLAALGRGVEGAGVLSFDRGFDRAEGVVRIDSAALGSRLCTAGTGTSYSMIPRRKAFATASVRTQGLHRCRRPHPPPGCRRGLRRRSGDVPGHAFVWHSRWTGDRTFPRDCSIQCIDQGEGSGGRRMT
jgi:predicted nucleic-acid-binding protein